LGHVLQKDIDFEAPVASIQYSGTALVGNIMALKILGAGFGRTGTHSLKLALDILGFGPCHHMSEIRKKPQLANDWYLAAAGESMDWEAVFEGFGSQMDWPGAAYWKELSDYFSDAKVILTVRDENSWFESIRQTIVPSVLIGRDLEDNPDAQSLAEMIYQTVYLPLFKGRLEEQDYAIEVYKKHIANVKATIPKNRLLTFDVKEGWEPLCSFLNVEVPDLPFPKSNSTEEFIETREYLPGNLES